MGCSVVNSNSPRGKIRSGSETKLHFNIYYENCKQLCKVVLLH